MTQEHQEPTDLVVAEQWEMPDKTRIDEVNDSDQRSPQADTQAPDTES